MTLVQVDVDVHVGLSLFLLVQLLKHLHYKLHNPSLFCRVVVLHSISLYRFPFELSITASVWGFFKALLFHCVILLFTSLSTIMYNTHPPYQAVCLSRENVPPLPLPAPYLCQLCCQLLQPVHHPSILLYAPTGNKHHINIIIPGGLIKLEPRCQTQTCSTVAINIWRWVVWLNCSYAAEYLHHHMTIFASILRVWVIPVNDSVPQVYVPHVKTCVDLLTAALVSS